MHILKPEGLDTSQPGTDVMDIKKIFKDKGEIPAAPGGHMGKALITFWSNILKIAVNVHRLIISYPGTVFNKTLIEFIRRLAFKQGLEIVLLG